MSRHRTVDECYLRRRTRGDDVMVQPLRDAIHAAKSRGIEGAK